MSMDDWGKVPVVPRNPVEGCLSVEEPPVFRFLFENLDPPAEFVALVFLIRSSPLAYNLRISKYTTIIIQNPSVIANSKDCRDLLSMSGNITQNIRPSAPAVSRLKSNFPSCKGSKHNNKRIVITTVH